MRTILLLIISTAFSLFAFSQNVGIGTSSPLNKLHVAGGFRLDTLTGVGGEGLLKHDASGVVYGIKFTGNTSDVLRGDGTFGAGSSGGPGSAWSLTGNAGTDATTNFIGTTDVQSLMFRVNNQPAGFISATTADIALGHFALSSTTGGYYNSAIGYAALTLNTEGYSNSAVGAFTLQSNSTGHSNTAMGSLALSSNTTGTENTAIGKSALYFNTGGYSNTANGVEALYFNTTGYGNTAIGRSALRANTTGRVNVAMGDAALAQNTTGEDNTAIGFYALEGNRTGKNNTASGALALGNTLYSENNTAIGHRAGFNFNNGWNNTFLGANTGASADDMFNCIAIGESVTCTASNQARIGNTSTQSLFFSGVYNSTTSSSANMVVDGFGQIMRSTSSARYKADIEDLDINTEQIYQLQARSYTSINDGQKYFGLVAEEVDKVIPELVEYAKEKEVIAGSQSDHLIPDAVRYPMLSVLLLKEMQKHEKLIEEQQTTIEKQQKQIDDLIKEVQLIKRKLK